MNSKIYTFEKQQLTIILLDHIFEEVQLNFLNSIPEALLNNTFNLDAKQYYLHALIAEICKFFENNRFTNKVLVVQPTFKNEEYEIWNFFSREEVSDFTIKAFKQLKTALPIPIFVSTDIIDFSSKSGEVEDIVNLLAERERVFKLNTITSRKLKKYTVKKGLTQLANTYIHSSGFKKLLY